MKLFGTLRLHSLISTHIAVSPLTSAAVKSCFSMVQKLFFVQQTVVHKCWCAFEVPQHKGPPTKKSSNKVVDLNTGFQWTTIAVLASMIS
jgi:hypothetical protein